jgi:coenzyme F420-0:L-glutamate ligase/coenzyme F420-1:gamma-L-glutamate ligase
MKSKQIAVIAVSGLPLVKNGDDLARLIVEALAALGERLQERDVLVVTQKVVSKAEGRLLELAEVAPSERARAIAAETKKDPRLVEVILREANEVVRVGPSVVITEHRLGFVMANSGVDVSNIEQAGMAEERVLCLPVDPDGSARRIREQVRARTNTDVGVVISDSAGRAWRMGVTSIAIGVSGVPALVDLRGQPDLFQRKLRVTEVALADLIASAANLVMGEAAEGTPVALVRGIDYVPVESSAKDLLRPKKEDLFR